MRERSMPTVKEALLQASSLLLRAMEERERIAGPAETAEAEARDRQALAQEARADAEALIMHVLGWDKTRLLLDGGAPFPDRLLGRWREAVRRRAAGEPVQYITGEQAFCGLTLEVGPAVLIPRPETELLVEAVAKRVRALFAPAGGGEGTADDPRRHASGRSGRPPLLADVGTGSGAIAIALARLLPGWRVAACDLSPEALDVARRNAARAEREEQGAPAGRKAASGGLRERLLFLQGDLLEPLIVRGERVDVLVSNPPYVPTGDILRLQREVRDHEPRLALDGGPDGLAAYRRIVRQIGRLPGIPRLVAFEVGCGQAGAVAALLAAAGWWTNFDIVRDYAGIERHVLAWRPQDARPFQN